MKEWDRNTPWRQGKLLDSAAVAACLEPCGVSISDETIVVVATHDCDLAQDPNVEPYVEVFVGRLLERSDGNCTHSKNARKLHIEFSGQTSFWGEFEATAKYAVDKWELNKFLPREDSLLTTDNYAIFQMWLASRYRRSAFPDEFERRLVSKEFKLHEKISKAVKPHGDFISGVFFDVDGGEERTRAGPDDTYVLDIIILHAADPDFMAAEKASNEAAQAIERAFKDKLFAPKNMWQHIELRFCDAISESVLTYQNFKRLKRWRLDYISLAAEPQQPITE